jgi:threonine/homoserine/homoserine lactone efflux protein
VPHSGVSFGGVVSWSSYGEFLAFACVLVLIPGPDFAVVAKNALISGRRRGWWASLGICTSSAAQGTAAAAGLGALIVRSEPVFEAVKWAGVCYLAFLGVQAMRSAIRGTYDEPPAGNAPAGAAAFGGWRQGFVSNITNPKVLVFYLAVLPQFVHSGTAAGWLLAFAWSPALLSLLYLLAVTAGLMRVRQLLSRRSARRTLDIATGTALLGFSARLAAERI